MDEMKIKSGLLFSKRTGSLVGCFDLGSTNRDMERLIGDDIAGSSIYATVSPQSFHRASPFLADSNKLRFWIAWANDGLVNTRH